MILRHINGRTEDILVPLFVGLVRPIIEYANPVWSPMYRKDINRIEKVQQNFTKRISGLNHLSYPERLERLNLLSLEFRRARGDMTLLKNINTILLILWERQIYAVRGHPHIR